MQIAVIAPGMMGAAIAQRLHACRAQVAVTLNGRSAASAERAVGLMTLPNEAALANWADVVLSILPPGEAVALAQRLAPVLLPRGKAVLFADCNAISPASMAAVAAHLPGIRLVDIGIIGGPPKGDDSGPRLYASGADAADLLALRDRGIDLRVIDGGLGAASALKLSYAGITKGIIALGSAMALGAARAGVGEALRAELAGSQPEVLKSLQRGVPDMFGKAYRWVAEMEEISAFLADMPAAPIYQAAARLYENLAEGGDTVATLRHFYRKPGP